MDNLWVIYGYGSSGNDCFSLLWKMDHRLIGELSILQCIMIFHRYVRHYQRVSPKYVQIDVPWNLSQRQRSSKSIASYIRGSGILKSDTRVIIWYNMSIMLMCIIIQYSCPWELNKIDILTSPQPPGDASGRGLRLARQPVCSDWHRRHRAVCGGRIHGVPPVIIQILENLIIQYQILDGFSMQKTEQC